MGVEYTAYLKRINKNNLESEIENCKDLIRIYEDKIKFFCFSTPADSFDDCDNRYRACDYITQEVSESLEELREQYSRLWLLECIKDEQGTEYVKFDEE